MNREIEVVADWSGLAGPTTLGSLRISRARGKESYAFAFHPEWLTTNPRPFLLDPELQWVRGDQFSGKGFGIFLDSAPDRWGRTLIARREARAARGEGRPPRPLMDSDYLLAVEDGTRMGGLRFRDPGTGDYLSSYPERAVPPLRRLRELESASRHLDMDEPEERDLEEGLKLLLAPGSSLGGARPKANVLDPEGGLWIAKFPRESDEVDVGAWEALVYELAREAGLRVTDARAERLSRHGHTFLARRFDRKAGGRVQYASAMTLLGYRDGDGAEQGAGYLELAELLCDYGMDIDGELEELWTRIVFSIAVGNTDDHLRNHGFLLGRSGWRLSPVFDLNPQPGAAGLSLNINEIDNQLDFALAEEVAPYFRLSPERASRILKRVRKVVAGWEALAKKRGIQAGEIERMRTAFHPG